MQRNCHPLVVLASGVVFGLLFLEPGLINSWTPVVTIIVLWIVSKTNAAKALFDIVSQTAEKRKGVIDEKDAELARLTVELKTTTRELRQAREFNDEDRLNIRELEARCLRYEREINQHRLKAGLRPLLAGSQDDHEQHNTS